MYGAEGPDTFWLDFTNIALGLVTLACVLVVAAGAFADLRRRLRAREHAAADDHSFATPELGVTMADGGEPVDEHETRRVG